MTENEVLREISRSLGRVEEGVLRLRQDFTEEKQTAAASRKAVYLRQDEFAKDLEKLRDENKISAHITAQVRDEVKAFKAQAMPTLEEYKRLRNMGLGVLAISGLSIAATLAMALDAVKSALRSWLG